MVDAVLSVRGIRCANDGADRRDITAIYDTPTWMRCLLAAIGLVITAANPIEAFAQSPRTQRPEGQQKTPASGGFDSGLLTALTRSAIAALQQANMTGNYTVMRDLGGPSFHERFDSAKLSAVFADLRGRRIDLLPVLLLEPHWIRTPELTQDGHLHLFGSFSTHPLEVRFEFYYIYANGAWRIDGIAVDAVPPAVASAPPAKMGPAKGEAKSDGTSRMP